MSTSFDSRPVGSPLFPPQNAPRVWFIIGAESPVAAALIRRLIAHGDYIVAGVLPSILHDDDGAPGARLRELQDEITQHDSLKSKLQLIPFDPRTWGQCQAAVAEAILAFGKIDIVLSCTNEVLFGTVEEVSQTARSRSLIREQFETNFFAPINLIKAILPSFRTWNNGHIIVLTGTTYEIAPFNIKVSIVQPNIEINVLTSRITSVPPLPPLPPYSAEENYALISRTITGGLLDKLKDCHADATGNSLSSPDITSFYPSLPEAFEKSLIAETVHALTAIGGHDNPPGRLIVGFEGILYVKEKLKTVSEELEDFVDVSSAVELVREQGRKMSYQSSDDSSNGGSQERRRFSHWQEV